MPFTVYTKFFWASPDILASLPDIWLNLPVALRQTFFIFAGLVRHVRRTSCRLHTVLNVHSAEVWHCDRVCKVMRSIKIFDSFQLPFSFFSVKQILQQKGILNRLEFHIKHICCYQTNMNLWEMYWLEQYFASHQKTESEVYLMYKSGNKTNCLSLLGPSPRGAFYGLYPFFFSISFSPRKVST